MARIAKTVVIDHNARRLLIDGQEFPWFVAPNITVETSSESQIAYVSIEVLADRVEVRPRARLDDDGDEDDQAEVEA